MIKRIPIYFIIWKSALQLPQKNKDDVLAIRQILIDENKDNIKPDLPTDFKSIPDIKPLDFKTDIEKEAPEIAVPNENKNDILQGFGHYPFYIKTGECTRFIKCTLKWRTNYEIKSI